MKQLNKLFIALTAFAIAFQTAFALPSSNVNGTIDQDNIYLDGQKIDAYAFFSNNYDDTPAAIVADVQELNSGAALDEVIKLDTTLNLGDLKLLTAIQDLSVQYTTGERIHGRVTLTWEVPSLSAVQGDVYVLHYSTIRNVWELLTPDAISRNKITCTFPDLSPVAVVYLEKSSTSGQQGSPGDDVVNTGDHTNVTTYVAVAVVALAAVSLLVKKAKKEM